MDCNSLSPSWDNVGGDDAEAGAHRQGTRSNLPF